MAKSNHWSLRINILIEAKIFVLPHVPYLLLLLLFFFFFHFFFFFLSSVTFLCGPSLPIECSSIPSFSGHGMPVSYSHCRQRFLNLIIPSSPWSSSFPYFFHSGSHNSRSTVPHSAKLPKRRILKRTQNVFSIFCVQVTYINE